MPCEDRVGRHERRDLPKNAPAQCLPFRSEPSSLLVSKADALLAGVLAENAVFRLSVFDGSKLVAIDVAGEGHDEEVPG